MTITLYGAVGTLISFSIISLGMVSKTTLLFLAASSSLLLFLLEILSILPRKFLGQEPVVLGACSCSCDDFF